MGKPKGTHVVPRGFDPEAKRFAQSVNESIGVLKGELGDPLDAAVTYKDLIDSGIAKRDIRINSNGEITGVASGGVFIVPGDGPVLDVPPAPTGLSVGAAFQNILIDWDLAAFNGFSHAEVWAATTNNFANRVFVGQTTANVFSHQVGTSQTRYYWVRFVNTQNVVGPFNSTTGVGGTTALIDTQHIADSLITAAKLVDGAVTEVKIATDAVTNAKIAVDAIQGDVIAASAITETKIATDSISSAKIQASAIIAGKIATNAIVAGNIQSNAVTADKIQANAVNADKIAANSVTAAEMATGTITAASGVIGNLAIGSAQIIDGAIENAKIGNLAVDNAKIHSLSALKITSDQIDTARINVSGLITAGGIIVGSDLSTNGGTTIHGGNIQTNTIAANRLTITPLEAGQAAGDINSNSTTIDGGKISTNSVTATQINTANLVLPSSGAAEQLIGPWTPSNTMQYKFVTSVGSGAGFYHGFVRMRTGTNHIKTVSMVFFDSATSAIVYDSGSTTTLPGLVTRFQNAADSANIPLAFEYTGSNTVNLFIYAQADSAPDTLYVTARFYKYSV